MTKRSRAANTWKRGTVPDIEAILDAILRGRDGKGLEGKTPIEIHSLKSALLEMLIPALGVLEEMKARIWDEGVSAQDTYLRDSILATGIEDPPAPKNPYRTGVA
jgi:hypothetical protein